MRTKRRKNPRSGDEKKTKKDEPARIIKLPEILAEEAEEEPDLTDLATRFIGKTAEVVEVKEKKRRKPEEAEKDKAKGPRRREVFQKEDLYTKKELAAQDDRGPFEGWQAGLQGTAETRTGDCKSRKETHQDR